MTPTPRPYPNYKSSGVQWLGDVPAHWEVVPLGRIGLFYKGSGGTKDDEVPDGIPCVRYGDLYTTHAHFIRRTRSCVSPAKASAYTPINRGDVLFPTSGETIEDIGKSAVNLMHTQVLCGGDLIVFRPMVPMEPKFAGYSLDCHSTQTQKSLMGRGITIMHIYSAQLKYFRLPLPPLPEQFAIVRYLDYVDRRIRRYIGAKRKLIALLGEERQAVVSRAVTRGLDPKVRLKPSGLPSLGDVPKHWEVVQLGRIGVFSKGSGGTKDDEVPDGIPCVRYGDLYTTHTHFIRRTRSFVSPARASAYTPINRGDVLFPTSGETIEDIGKSAVNLMHTQVLCGGDLIVFRPMVPMEPKFAGYSLDCHSSQTQKSLMGRGITIMHIYSAQLKYFWLPLPPLPEQAAIVEYLDKATTNIDAAIARTRRQVELVQEYRTRLIADVVTGKLDVREAAAQLPDETDEEEPVDESSSFADDINGNPFDADETMEERVEEPREEPVEAPAMESEVIT